MKNIIANTYEFRPLKAGGYLRYAEGLWIPDDGQYDLAFVNKDIGNPIFYYVNMPYYDNLSWKWVAGGNWRAYIAKHPNGNAWHYMLHNPENKSWGKAWKRDFHPNVIASERGRNKCCELHYGGANGGGVEFNILDPYIGAGVVRIKATQEIVKPPKHFVCMYCGEIKIG